MIFIVLQNKNIEETIDDLKAGKSEKGNIEPVFGVTPTTIIVYAGESSKQATFFVLGPLVLNLKEI